MKTKQFLFFAAAAAMFAACSSSDDGLSSSQVAQSQGTGEIAVNFNSYVNRTTTRAGQIGEQNLDAIKTDKVGFGVFGYYTNADNYDQSFIPDFMYNQQVKWNGTDTWTYSPIKYWPNEFGSAAFSDDVDKVSFFAYAPFVSVNASSGKVKDNHASTYGKDNGDVTMGIVGMKRNNDTGDPMIKYISTFYTDEQVDLTWGTMDATSYASGWSKKNGGTPQTVTAGMPWLNMEHPYATSSTWGTAQRIVFDFKHALASLNVTVDVFADVVTPDGATTPVNPAAGTKVYVRSVTFEGFDTKGALNLNNTVASKALWYNFDFLNELNNGAETTIKDGRKDGKEGLTAATKEYAAINPTLVQSTTWGGSGEPAGVTVAPTNLFAQYNGGGVIQPEGDEEAPIFVIPNGDPLKVTIEYDVLTADQKLPDKLNDGVTPGSVVKNVITRYITSNKVGSTSPSAFILENGKKYTIKLHLGLNSVQFDASVTGWGNGGDGGADLPHNN